MKGLDLNYIMAGLSFLLIIITGVFLKKSGSPYNAIMVAVHKIVTLAFIVFAVLIVVNLQKVSSIGALNLTLLIIAGLLTLLASFSGSILSKKNESIFKLILMHKVTSAGLILIIALVTYLFLTTS